LKFVFLHKNLILPVSDTLFYLSVTHTLDLLVTFDVKYSVSILQDFDLLCCETCSLAEVSYTAAGAIGVFIVS
jgi:hypothetical protein